MRVKVHWYSKQLTRSLGENAMIAHRMPILRFWILVVLLVVAVGALHAGAEEIRIGALFNATGGMSTIGTPGMKGARLAVDLINKRGGLLNGRKVRLMAEDTKTNPKVYLRMADKLVSEGVVAALGYGDSNPAFAVGQVFQKAMIPFVTSGATDPGLPERVGNYFFMAAYGDNEQAEAMADYAYGSLGARTVVIWVNKGPDFTLKLAGFFKQRFLSLGGKVLAVDLYDQGETDFSTLIKKLKSMSEKPAALFISGIPEDAVRSVEQVRRAGIAAPILSGDGFDADIVERLGNPVLADKVYFSTHSYRFQDRSEVKDFIAAYEAEYGHQPENAFAALGFDAVNLIADASSRAKRIDPKEIAEALARTRDFHGVTGTISFTSTSAVPFKPVAIMGILNGNYKLMETWTPKSSR